MPDVGDEVPLTLTVTPADTTTVAACTYRLLPTGEPVALPTVPNADRTEWSALLPIAQLGAYRITWTVTGTGEGIEYDTVYAVGGPDPVGRSYATLADLAAYMGGDPPPGAGRLLTSATRLVDALLIGAVYPTIGDGMPANTRHQQALRDAVCAQVAWFDETGDSSGNTAGGSVSIGNISISASTSSRGGGGGSGRYAPDVILILRTAGLLPLHPLVYG